MAPPGSHTLEALPYAQMGANKIVFLRNDLQGQGWRNGVYRIDPVAGTSTFEFNGGTGWYVDDPQVSSDGRYLVYTHWTDNNTLFDVYVSNLDGSGQVQASNFPMQEGPASWTPDATQILFYAAGTDGNYNLYRQPPSMPTGTQRVQLTHFALGSGCPSFSAEGDRVSVSPTGQIVWHCGTQIELTAADGSATTTIHTVLAFCVPVHRGAWRVMVARRAAHRIHGAPEGNRQRRRSR